MAGFFQFIRERADVAFWIFLGWAYLSSHAVYTKYDLGKKQARGLR